MLESAVPVDEREYDAPPDQIRELLVQKNYFSLKDIEICRNFDIQTLSTEPRFAEIQVLFNEFMALYACEFSS